MFITSYLYNKCACGQNISENDHKMYDDNFCAKKVKIENFDQVVGFPMERLISSGYIKGDLEYLIFLLKWSTNRCPYSTNLYLKVKSKSTR